MMASRAKSWVRDKKLSTTEKIKLVKTGLLEQAIRTSLKQRFDIMPKGQKDSRSFGIDLSCLSLVLRLVFAIADVSFDVHCRASSAAF